MARTHIGRLSLGGMVALCAILLLAPETHSQTIRRKKFTISGSVGQPGVTMQGLPGSPISDDNGVYSAEVDVNWSGTVTPVKLGFVFEPKSKPYARVASNLANENYTGRILIFTIAGSTGQPGVKLTGLPGDPVSDQSGRYSVVVDFGWSGSCTPEKMGYRFEPSMQMYSQVKEDHKNDAYTPHALMFKISGTAGAAGIVLKGLPGDPTTKEGGAYSVEVGYGWKGTITPTREGYTFDPPSRDYDLVVEDQTNQDYSATVFSYKITGTTGMPGVLLKGLPDDPVTDSDGLYTAVVEHGWSGKVTPEKAGYTFDPPLREYSKVVTDTLSQDYNPAVVYQTISGKTGVGNVTLDGLPGNVTSDSTGVYTVKVEYGWSGTVTPTKEGYFFDPPERLYDAVTKDEKQDYKAQAITFTISGNTGIGGVALQVQGLPGSPTSGADGTYRLEVPYKWKGTVTPKKAGFTFEPPKRDYEDVLAPASDSYDARIMQYAISGRVTGESGPVADVLIVTEGGAASTTTDANGEFQLLVDHGSKVKITPEKAGFTFTPIGKSFDTVTQPMTQAFTGKIKMLTITKAIKLGDEPIANVKVTVQPGGQTATTDNKGKYTIKVPYGWTGELVLEHAEFEFDPNTVPFTSVTENIDDTVAPRPAVDSTSVPPLTQTPLTQTPLTQTPLTQTPLTQTPAPLNPQLALQISGTEQRLKTEQTRAAQLTQAGRPVPPQLTQQITRLEQELATLRAQAQPAPQPPVYPDLQPSSAAWPPVPQPAGTTMLGQNLIQVLMGLAQQSGANIAVDLTVKPIPVAVPYNLTGVPVAQALQTILQGTDYRSQYVGDNTYLVYKPMTQMITGDDLRQVLQDLSTAAEVSIIPDANVMGEVWADLRDLPLERALETILAGTPYVVKKTPNYYLVADRNPLSISFVDVSEMQEIRLNYLTPERARALLSAQFKRYVEAEPVDPRDPNNRGHLLTVTAPTKLREDIIKQIRQLDTRPRQVLLEARGVVMEHGNLLNLGVEWGFPTLSAGAFYDSTLENVPDIAANSMTGIQIGYTPGRDFTNSLLAALNLLQENSQVDIVSSPKILAQDNKQSELRQITEEWFFMTGPISANTFFSQAELQKIDSGTVLVITPRIGDNNDITLDMAVEVSDSIPRGRGSALPVVTRRIAKNSVTVQDGGTVALAGLTENRARAKEKRVPGLSNIPLLGGLFKNNDEDESNKEIAVFVTAYLVRDPADMSVPALAPGETAARAVPAGQEFTDNLREALARQSQ